MFSLLTIAALAVAAAASPAAYKLSNVRITDGEDAQIENYPYQVSLEYRDRNRCSGSIISANYILTAAHCVSITSTDNIIVRAGSSLQGQGGSVHQVEKALLHEKYGSSEHYAPLNDIALLRLREPIAFDETKQPIELYEQDEEAAVGSLGVVSGWGDGFRRLQALPVPIIAKKACNDKYSFVGGLPAEQICAGYDDQLGHNACYGDDGAPLVVSGRLAGIFSWRQGCGSIPAIFTEVAAYRDWINEHAQL